MLLLRSSSLARALIRALWKSIRKRVPQSSLRSRSFRRPFCFYLLFVTFTKHFEGWRAFFLIRFAIYFLQWVAAPGYMARPRQDTREYVDSLILRIIYNVPVIHRKIVCVLEAFYLLCTPYIVRNRVISAACLLCAIILIPSPSCTSVATNCGLTYNIPNIMLSHLGT